MPHLEPTYLRFIYDGLIKGSVHPENAAELPDGLIGMYEEAFDERTSVVERQKLLQRFAIWALFKKDVSAEFVAEVLGESEDDIQEFISAYSAWFNSPESGKYQLYHERLKVYLLQKLSEQESHTLQEQLITRLEQAIEEQKADEFERYGLEFLASHLAVAAMLNGDGKKLIDLAYSQTHWQRQLKISKGYSWTKNGLKELMSWASKYNDDEVIECGLQMVDLHHQEQNAAPQIVALVAEGDFDAALKRIEQFGGNDKEGLQRKFILYMLCLMELTLLESRNKPFRKEGLDKILKHLDEQLPVDHSLLNWGDFFPSYLVFKIAQESVEVNIDYRSIYKRTSAFETEWLSDNLLNQEIHLKVIKDSIQYLVDEEKISALCDTSLAIARQAKTRDAIILIHECLDLSKKIHNNTLRCRALVKISSSLFLQNKDEKAETILNEAIKLSKEINCLEDRCEILREISNEISIQGKIEESHIIEDNALEIARKISDQLYESYAFYYICIKSLEQGDIEEAIDYSVYISSEKIKDDLIKKVAFQFIETGRIEEGINWANENYENYINEKPLLFISKELSKRGEFEQALKCSDKLGDYLDRIKVLENLSIELAHNNLIKECFTTIIKILNSRLNNIDSDYKDFILHKISAEYSKKNNLVKALYCVKKIHSKRWQEYTYKTNSLILCQQKKYSKALELIDSISLESYKSKSLKEFFSEISHDSFNNKILNSTKLIFNIIDKIIDDSVKTDLLFIISLHFSRLGLFEKEKSIFSKAVQKIKEIDNKGVRRKILIEIAPQYAKFGKSKLIKELIFQYLGNEDEKSIRCSTLIEISEITTAQGKINESKRLLMEAFKCVEEIAEKNIKEKLIRDISVALAKQGNIFEAIKQTEKIQDTSLKFQSFKNISVELVRLGLFRKAIQCVNRIDNDNEHDLALISICEELLKLGLIDKAILISQDICNVKIKNSALKNISIYFIKTKQIELAFKFAKSLTIEEERSLAFKSLAIEAARMKNWQLIESFINEISNTKLQFDCFLEIGEIVYYEFGEMNSFHTLNEIVDNKENKAIIFRGWINQMKINCISKEVIVKSILQTDISMFEFILRTYFLSMLFFNENLETRTYRFENTLNLKWAVDIKNQLN